jgi:small-conductance mechanosensitive channel
VVLAGLTTRALERVLRGRGLAEPARLAVSRLAGYAVAVLGTLVAAGSVGFDLDALVAGSAILRVGIGFGLQKVAENFISGLILLVEQPVRKGDFVRVGHAFGWIEEIGMRATRVLTRDEVTIIVPNSELVTSQVVNHSTPTPRLRLSVSVGVAYGSDAPKVRDVLLEVARASDRLLPEPPPDVRFDAFGESSLDFALLVWISNPADDRRVASELRFGIERAFRENGITIPFPQRDLHLKTGFEAVRAAEPRPR